MTPAPLSGDLAFMRDFDSFSICERTYEPNLRIKLHSHQNTFLNVPVVGSCTEIVAGKVYVIRSGMVWYRSEPKLFSVLPRYADSEVRDS